MIPYKKHVVQFKDGEYGLRRLGIYGWEFFDFKDGDGWIKVTRDYQERKVRVPLEQVVRKIDLGKRVSRKILNQTRVVNALKGDI